MAWLVHMSCRVQLAMCAFECVEFCWRLAITTELY